MTQLQNFYEQHNELPLSVCSEAINLIFPSVEPRVKQKLVQFIKRKFYTINCCVLYRINKEFYQLCQQLDLDPGNQEVIIRENFSVFYSQNFNISPLNIHERS